MTPMTPIRLMTPDESIGFLKQQARWCDNRDVQLLCGRLLEAIGLCDELAASRAAFDLDEVVTRTPMLEVDRRRFYDATLCWRLYG